MSQPPEDKKPDFSNFPRGAIGIKGLPVGRNARLPSIRSPRDLTLGSQPKRTFTPNIPVRREKKPDSPNVGDESSSGSSSHRNTPKNTPSKAERGRGRGRGRGQFIQLEGSVFGEGIAPSTPKASSSRQRESVSKSEFSSGRPYIKKERSDYDMQNMEQEMKKLMRDDFIDDGDDSSDDELQRPIVFPAKEIKEKPENDEKLESFQNQEFAKTMGFNVEKIAKFIKKEKMEEPYPVMEPDWSKIPKNEVTKLFTNSDSPFFLLQIPRVVTTQADPYQSNTVENVDHEEKKNETMLTSMPDGDIGVCQILKSGRVRIKLGSLFFYIENLTFNNTVESKCEINSLEIDSGSGNLITLGTCAKSFILEPDIDSLMPDFNE